MIDVPATTISFDILPSLSHNKLDCSATTTNNNFIFLWRPIYLEHSSLRLRV